MNAEQLEKRYLAGEDFYVEITKGKHRNHILKVRDLCFENVRHLVGPGIRYFQGIKVMVNGEEFTYDTWKFKWSTATEESIPDPDAWPLSLDTLGYEINKGDIISASSGGHRIGRVESIATSGQISCTNMVGDGKFKVNPLGDHKDRTYTNVLRLNDVMDNILMARLKK